MKNFDFAVCLAEYCNVLDYFEAFTVHPEKAGENFQNRRKLQKSVGRGLAPAVAGTARPRGRLKITKIHLKFEKTSLLTQNFQKVLTSATDSAKI